MSPSLFSLVEYLRLFPFPSVYEHELQVLLLETRAGCAHAAFVSHKPLATAPEESAPGAYSLRLKESQVHTSMFKKKKDIWPSPELSIGRPCPTNSSSGCCWEAIGPARDAFQEVAEKIGKLFQSQNDYLDEGEEHSFTFSYGIWMVGWDKTHAVPTIILGCESTAVRTKAKNVLKDSGLLKPFPGIALKPTSRTPDPLAGGDNLGEFKPFESNNDGNMDSIYTFNGAKERCGIPIFLGGANNPPPRFARKATMGGTILVDGVAYGLSVSHVFSSNLQRPRNSAKEELIVFDEDSDTDAESFVEMTSKGKRHQSNPNRR